MKNREPKNLLKSFSWTYIVLAAIILIFVIVMNLIPDFGEKAKEITGQDNAVIAFNTIFVVNIIIYIWYFWLARRVANGKSKGTLYLVLLALGAIGGIISLFAGPVKGHGTFDLALDIVGLYFVWNVRKENQ